MLNRNFFFNSLVITLLSIILAACGDKFATVSGYTPEKLTKERIDQLFKETIENMVFVKGGSFMMGCLDSEKSLEPSVLKYIGSERATKQRFFFDSPVMPCKPEYKVTLDSFSIGKFEVSYGEYDLFTQEAGLSFLQEKEFHYKVKLDKNDDSREGDKSANAGWHQANRYCEWLVKKTGLSFALPTEAQWEYAARSRGLNVPYATDTGYWDQGINYPKFGFDDNEEDGMTAKDMNYPPNPLGIYHMSDLMTE